MTITYERLKLIELLEAGLGKLKAERLKEEKEYPEKFKKWRRAYVAAIDDEVAKLRATSDSNTFRTIVENSKILNSYPRFEGSGQGETSIRGGVPVKPLPTCYKLQHKIAALKFCDRKRVALTNEDQRELGKYLFTAADECK